TNRGSVLARMKRHGDAIASYDHALSLDTSYERAQTGKALALMALNRVDDALAVFGNALAANPDSVSLKSSRADALLYLRRSSEAVRTHDAVLRLEPALAYTRGNLAFCTLYCCDWRTIGTERAAISQQLMAGRPVGNPFQNIALSDSPDAQLRCARIAMEDK